jgi:hypothetical protein
MSPDRIQVLPRKLKQLIDATVATFQEVVNLLLAMRSVFRAIIGSLYKKSKWD